MRLMSLLSIAFLTVLDLALDIIGNIFRNFVFVFIKGFCGAESKGIGFIVDFDFFFAFLIFFGMQLRHLLSIRLMSSSFRPD